MKINIFYRHYNANITNQSSKHRPNWFDYEICFVNLIETIKNKNIELHVIFDGENYEENFIHKYESNFKLHKITEGSDFKSFIKTWNIVKSLNIGNNELIYFLENDYLHTENWVDKVIDFFSKNNDFNYLSLYDHLDKYVFEYYSNLQSSIIISKTHHWRTTPSTCGSFIVTKKLFDEDYDVHTSFEGDQHKFIKLTTEKNRKILTPIPGLSTHCSYELHSPTINWEEINEKFKKFKKWN